eukprot:2132039-Karenia_brevis.AAC.1
MAIADISVEIGYRAELEYAAYYNEMGNTVQEALNSGDSSRVYKVLQPFYKKATASTAVVKSEEGTLLTNYTEVRHRWMDHFAKALCGKPTTFEQLVSRHRARTAQDVQAVARMEKDVGVVPSLLGVTQALVHLNGAKGCGEDLIGPEVAVACGRQLAKVLHPLYVKSALRVEAPLQYKGGQIVELFKGRGASDECASFRDVLLGDVCGQPLSSHYRGHAKPVLETYALDTQYGSGLHGGATDVAHLLLRAMLDCAAVAKMSCAILFIDVISAFASVCRVVGLPIPDSDDIFARRLKDIGMEAAQIDEIMGDLSDFSDWYRAKGTDHLLQCIAEYHRST